MSFGRWLSEYVTGSVSLFAEELNFSDPAPGICPDQIPLVCSQLGTQTTTGFRTSLFRDTRDYFLGSRNVPWWGIGLSIVACLGSVIAIALLSPLSYILVLTAMVFTPVSLVAPAREVSILFAALMGAHLLREGDVMRRSVAALGMVLGMSGLALG